MGLRDDVDDKASLPVMKKPGAMAAKAAKKVRSPGMTERFHMPGCQSVCDGSQRLLDQFYCASCITPDGHPALAE